MPMTGKGKRSMRYPSKTRGITGNGKNQSGGGSSGKSSGSMGMGASKTKSSSRKGTYS